MANEFVKVTDQNGVDHPVKDNAAFPRSEQAVLGAVNLCPMNAQSGTPANLTITANADRSFAVVGTANATDNYARTTFIMNKGTYYLSGVTGGKSGNTALYELHLKIGSTDIRNYDGFTEFTIANDNTEVLVEFIYRSGAVIDTVVKPMISLASGIPYAPYVMTNRELTDEVKKFINSEVVSGSVTVPNNTDTEIGSVTASKGTSIIMGMACFGQESTPYDVKVSFSEMDGSTPSGARGFSTCGRTSNLGNSGIQLFMYQVNLSADHTFKLFVKHNKGSDATVYPFIRVLKI